MWVIGHHPEGYEAVQYALNGAGAEPTGHTMRAVDISNIRAMLRIRGLHQVSAGPTLPDGLESWSS